jgi:3-oxoacyl-[acyl-carrier protein] reductase
MGESLLKVLKLTEEEYLEKYTLSKRFVEPDEIADTVIFLIKTPSITGQTIVIDAGLSLITFRSQSIQ